MCMTLCVLVCFSLVVVVVVLLQPFAGYSKRNEL